MKILAIFFSVLHTGFNSTSFGQKPNIIWIITEDMSPELGCYGYTGIQTPNLDRLAAEGARFTNAFATGPVCSASRSAIITGMYQTSIDAQNHRSHRDDGYHLPAPVKPVTEYFRQAGYFVTNANVKDGELNAKGKTDYNFITDTPVFDGIDWKERKAGQPFFAQVMIGVTHRGPIWKGAVQKHEPQIDPSKVKFPSVYPDHPVTREDWATYLESIQLMDSYVGTIIKRIESEGLSKNTVVIFSSDHGRCMIRDKQFLYDGGLRVPLIVRWPEKIRAGTVDERMLSLIDITASCMDIAGVKIPSYLEGKPVLGKSSAGRDHIIAARDRMDETVDKMRCVRTKDFKYIKNYMPDKPYMQANKYKENEYPVWNLMKQLKAEGKLTESQALFAADTKPAEELYDLRSDPDEVHNLAAQPKYREKMDQMRKILESWIKTTGDKGQYPEKKAWLPANSKD